MTAQDRTMSSHPAKWDRAHLIPALATAARYARFGARRMSLPRADREDLQQDILVTLLERSGRFDPDRGSWSTFVTLLARRAVMDAAVPGIAESPALFTAINKDRIFAFSRLASPSMLMAPCTLVLVVCTGS